MHDWVNNREAGDLRRYRAHYDVIVMMVLFRNDISTNGEQPEHRVLAHTL